MVHKKGRFGRGKSGVDKKEAYRKAADIGIIYSL